jgi:hypothetical protein
MKRLLILGLLAIMNANLHAAADSSPLKGKYAKILDSLYEKLNGKTAQIEGDSKEIWEIEDVWMSSKSFQIYAISNYLRLNPPQTGRVYYGKVDSLGYCFHESWLKEIDTLEGKKEKSARDEITSAQVGNTTVVGPKWFCERMQQKP